MKYARKQLDSRDKEIQQKQLNSAEKQKTEFYKSKFIEFFLGINTSAMSNVIKGAIL